MQAKALQKLSEQALAVLARPESQRFCQPTVVRRQRCAVRQFKYNLGNISLTFEPRLVQREEWALSDQYRFINQRIKPLSSYAFCAETLTRSFRIRRDLLEPRLARYLQVLLATYRDAQDKSIIAPLSLAFLEELSGEPAHWSIKGAIRGVALKTNQCRFGKYLLRRPTAADFDFELGAEETDPHPMQANPPSAIIEFTTRGRDHYVVRREYAAVLNILRLFRVGSVRSVALAATPSSVLQTAGIVYSVGSAPAPYRYILCDTDQAALARFLERHLSCATGLDNIQNTPGKRPVTCLVYRTYTSALLNRGPAQHQLQLALTCLEALLLRPSERSGTPHQQLLAKRLSSLLHQCNIATEPVAVVLQQAYGVLATADHRPPQSAKADDRSVTALAHSVLNYTRIGLIAFLRTADGLSTEQIIEHLEGMQRSTRRLFKGVDIPL